MNTKKVIASYAVELQEDENGSQWITVTPQEPSEDFSALRVTGTYLGIYATIRKLLNVLLDTSEDHQRYRC